MYLSKSPFLCKTLVSQCSFKSQLSTVRDIELQSLVLDSFFQSSKSLFDCIPESENVSCWDGNANSSVPSVISAYLIAGYLYLVFFSLHFACLFHSQSFQQVYPKLSASVATSQLALCWICAIHHERDVREEQHPYISGANKQKQNERNVWSLCSQNVNHCTLAAQAFQSEPD